MSFHLSSCPHSFLFLTVRGHDLAIPHTICWNTVNHIHIIVLKFISVSHELDHRTYCMNPNISNIAQPRWETMQKQRQWETRVTAAAPGCGVWALTVWRWRRGVFIAGIGCSCGGQTVTVTHLSAPRRSHSQRRETDRGERGWHRKHKEYVGAMRQVLYSTTLYREYSGPSWE